MIGYRQSDVTLYDDQTMPTVTEQPYLSSLCYVDKHPQPSGDGPTGSLPTVLGDYHGEISSDTSRVVVQYHQTGGNNCILC